jgi:hypothetical protein
MILKKLLFVVFICKYVFDNFYVLRHIIPYSCEHPYIGSILDIFKKWSQNLSFTIHTNSLPFLEMINLMSLIFLRIDI